ncbi:FAD-dependent oxidoreductase [Kibdelosporangium lantanae]
MPNMNIVILGGGYAGVSAAINLAARVKRLDDVTITLVNASDRFTERLRLHQTLTGQQTAELELPALLAGTGVEFVQGWVTAIDTATQTVRVDDSRVLPYDTLVYALGAVADSAEIPGVDDHAFTLNTRQDAELLASRLPNLRTVVVAGSGLTGVECAAEIAEQHPHLEVVLLGRQEPAAAMTPKARAHVRAVLDRLGVQVRGGAEIVKVLPDSVTLAGGETIAADAVLWTSGVRVSPLAAAAGLEVDGHGRIVTDPTLRSVSQPNVYAIGDAAAIRQGYGVMHGTCQSGMPTGVHAAVSIARELNGKAPKRFRFGYIHAPVSLGRRDAVIQFTRPDDTPKRFSLRGKVAVWYKETVSSSPWPAFLRMKKHPGLGSLAWRRGGRYTR